MSSKVWIVPGCIVKGSHGKLQLNTNWKNRRIKEKVIGTVISAICSLEMDSLFDYNGKVKKVTPKSLTLVSSLAGIPIHVPDLQVSNNDSIAIIHKTNWSHSYSMSISFLR